jgi:hypothetical protein
LRHCPEAKASTSIRSLTSTGSPAGPGTSTIISSGTNAALAPHSARRNSTASSTLRSAVVASSSIASTRVNSAERCER